MKLFNYNFIYKVNFTTILIMIFGQWYRSGLGQKSGLYPGLFRPSLSPGLGQKFLPDRALGHSLRVGFGLARTKLFHVRLKPGSRWASVGGHISSTLFLMLKQSSSINKQKGEAILLKYTTSLSSNIMTDGPLAQQPRIGAHSIVLIL